MPRPRRSKFDVDTNPAAPVRSIPQGTRQTTWRSGKASASVGMGGRGALPPAGACRKKCRCLGPIDPRQQAAWESHLQQRSVWRQRAPAHMPRRGKPTLLRWVFNSGVGDAPLAVTELSAVDKIFQDECVITLSEKIQAFNAQLSSSTLNQPIVTPQELEAVKADINSVILPLLNTILEDSNKACAKL